MCDTNEKVLALVANINKDNSETQNEETTSDEVMSSNLNTFKNIVKGKPKSGRFWKSERQRFSSVVKTKGLKQNFERKTALRIELKRTKELSKQVMEELKEKQLLRKERRRENLKRTEENKKKAEIVQVITNSAKLKRMKKKQLKFIQKRDTNKDIESKN